jgi:hypothetical protein
VIDMEHLDWCFHKMKMPNHAFIRAYSLCYVMNNNIINLILLIILPQKYDCLHFKDEEFEDQNK